MKEYRQIDYRQAVDFLLPRHYSGRIPNVKYAYGVFDDNGLVAVLTFGIPASPSLCRGVAGDKWKSKVIELNRLCRVVDYTEQLSEFVAWCLHQLKQYNLIVVSYSDTAMNHHGYIYQACNFMYTGETKSRTDKYTIGNKHSRHYDNAKQSGLRKIRSAKYRYIYICANKRIKKEMLADLKYKVYNKYPKGDNSDDYMLGEYLKPKVVKDVRI